MDNKKDKLTNLNPLFRGEPERAFIFNKVEKLAHAIFVLMGKRGETAQLTERIEVVVLESVREAAAQGTYQDNALFVAVLLELVSLLRLAGTSGFIHPNNVEVLVTEYLSVLARLTSPAMQGMMLRPEELMAEGEEERAPVALPESVADRLERTLKDRSEIPQQRPMRQLVEAPREVRKSISHKGQSVQKSISTDGDRSQKILAVVKEKGSVSIRDVAAVVKNCSEKTIQRELLALVKQGILRKEGERRWSTYRLI